MRKTIFFLFFFIQAFAQSPVENLKKLSETEPDKALSIWENVYRNADEAGKVKALLSVSQAYILKGDRKNCFYYFEKAELREQEIDTPLLTSEVLLNKSGLYLVIGLYEEAEKYAGEGIKTAEKIENRKDKNWISADLFYLLVTIRSLNKKEKNPIPIFKKITNLYLESNLSEEEKDKRLLVTYHNLGSLYFDKAQVDSADYYFKKALKNRGIDDNPFVKGLTHEKIGEIAYQKNNIEEALQHLNKATPLLVKYKDPNLRTNYALLSKLFDKKGDQKQALEFKSLQNEFNSKLNSSTQDALKLAYYSLEKNRVKAESKAENIKMLLIISSIGFIIVLGSVLYYFKKKKEKQRELFQNIISKFEHKLKENSSNLTVVEFSDKNQGQIEPIKESLIEKNIPDNIEKELFLFPQVYYYLPYGMTGYYSGTIT
ncbi:MULTISPECIES: tetratricopeptide repeat protein [unclassified Chryseobacterium]|uniref:tetratricopeptide repeat protein n=1 Tax=unclassified Chryseobacterium TaxID=2593645 RepID=UPI0030104861